MRSPHRLALALMVVSLTCWRIDSVKVAAGARAAQAAARATAPADRRATAAGQAIPRTAPSQPSMRPRELATVGVGVAGSVPARPATAANDALRIRLMGPRFDTGFGPQPTERRESLSTRRDD